MRGSAGPAWWSVGSAWWSARWEWLQRAWWLSPLSWVLVVVLDLQLDWAPNYAILGVIDEPAHTLTSMIVVLAVAAVLPVLCAARVVPAWAGRLPAAAAAGALLAGNLIDADHLPAVLGTQILTAGTPRPYSHSITTIVLLGLAAAGLTRAGQSRATWPHSRLVSRFLAGAALGISGHLGRDLVGTTSVSLFWPFTDHAFGYPHRDYLAGLLVLAVVPLTLKRWRGNTGLPDDRRRSLTAGIGNVPE